MIFRNICYSEGSKKTTPSEVPSLIDDCIEKELVSILQLELNNYDKCGRFSGRLGSIYTVSPGHETNGVGIDIWQSTPNSQLISAHPELITLKSRNLEALLALYEKLDSEIKKTQFINCLINRIDQHKGYLSISYFIVCVLWKLGYLSKALNKVKSDLLQGENLEYGFSNVLMLLGGLLRNHHSDFPDELLDFIEQFIHGLNEQTFFIREKITEIRRLRLLDHGYRSTHILEYEADNKA